MESRKSRFRSTKTPGDRRRGGVNFWDKQGQSSEVVVKGRALPLELGLGASYTTIGRFKRSSQCVQPHIRQILTQYSEWTPTTPGRHINPLFDVLAIARTPIDYIRNPDALEHLGTPTYSPVSNAVLKLTRVHLAVPAANTRAVYDGDHEHNHTPAPSPFHVEPHRSDRDILVA
jgi:hypothetical protein